ncbi:MAG: hypothetical protein JWP40_4244 [Blastococcus sp.]|jgi:hypothetical protein|nr:hypothetical protein [Blastococcus sp.]
MRKSRVLLAGVAVAAAAVATSAYTASNDLSAGDAVLGYGEATVTGATVDSIDYVRDSTDNSKLSSVVFHTSTTLTTETGTMTLKNGATVLGNYTCILSGTAPAQKYTCATTAGVDAFDTVGLTVGGQ